MKVTHLHSIQTADKRYATQTNPVLIGCDDMNSYVCKYGDGNSFAQRLLCEYLAAQFMRVWQLPMPDFALIKINPNHIPPQFGIAPKSFNQTCFGSKYSRQCEDLTHPSYLNSSNFRTDFNKQILLKIALFDCWLSNDDRTAGNHNLMFDLSNNNILAIDNEGIFNGRIFNYEIFSQNFNDSILSSEFAQKMYRKKELTPKMVKELKTYFYHCTSSCQQVINNVMSHIPADWNIDKDKVNGKIDEIFSNKWQKETFITFAGFVKDLKKNI